jgi:hypothetical protein
MGSGPDRSPELTVWTVRSIGRAEPSCLGRLLEDRLHLDEQLDRVADHHAAAVHGDVGRDVEVLAVDLTGGREPGPGAAVGVLW